MRRNEILPSSARQTSRDRERSQEPTPPSGRPHQRQSKREEGGAYPGIGKCVAREGPHAGNRSHRREPNVVEDQLYASALERGLTGTRRALEAHDEMVLVCLEPRAEYDVERKPFVSASQSLELSAELPRACLLGGRVLDHPGVVREGVDAVGGLQSIADRIVLQGLDVHADPLRHHRTGEQDHEGEQPRQQAQSIPLGRDAIPHDQDPSAHQGLHPQKEHEVLQVVEGDHEQAQRGPCRQPDGNPYPAASTRQPAFRQQTECPPGHHRPPTHEDQQREHVHEPPGNAHEERRNQGIGEGQNQREGDGRPHERPEGQEAGAEGPGNDPHDQQCDGKRCAPSLREGAERLLP